MSKSKITYFLHIAYDGSKYSGWQRQVNGFALQERIENDLERIFREKITLYGCGRTDAGVHASQYYCHIKLSDKADFDIKFRLNKNLPDDIRVFDVIEVEEEQHCRYDVTARTYDYYAHFYEDPFLEKYSTYYNVKDLDFESMKSAASLLPKYQDFKSLCRRSHLFPDTSCDVTVARLFVSADMRRIRFNITSNRFLQGMIRITVHFLIKIGKGEMTLADFEEMLATQSEVKVKRQAPPQGLYLSKIIYPYLDLPPSSAFGKMLQVGLRDN